VLALEYSIMLSYPVYTIYVSTYRQWYTVRHVTYPYMLICLRMPLPSLQLAYDGSAHLVGGANGCHFKLLTTVIVAQTSLIH